jgi:hypothetical protein
MPHQLPKSILVDVRDQRLRCPVCEEVIGVYEPIVVVEGGAWRRTSMLNEPMLDSDQTVMHHHCAQSISSPPPEG